MITQEFIGKLILIDVDGDSWILDEPFGYMSKAGNRIMVPSGFVTDLASVPRLFWRIFPKSGPYNKAAVIHDWMYRNHLFDRYDCDDIFLDAMLFDGVGYFKAHLIWAGVRLGGCIPWNDEGRKL